MYGCGMGWDGMGMGCGQQPILSSPTWVVLCRTPQLDCQTRMPSLNCHCHCHCPCTARQSITQSIMPSVSPSPRKSVSQSVNQSMSVSVPVPPTTGPSTGMRGPYGVLTGPPVLSCAEDWTELGSPECAPGLLLCPRQCPHGSTVLVLPRRQLSLSSSWACHSLPPSGTSRSRARSHPGARLVLLSAADAGMLAALLLCGSSCFRPS